MNECITCGRWLEDDRSECHYCRQNKEKMREERDRHVNNIRLHKGQYHPNHIDHYRQDP